MYQRTGSFSDLMTAKGHSMMTSPSSSLRLSWCRLPEGKNSTTLRARTYGNELAWQRLSASAVAHRYLSVGGRQPGEQTRTRCSPPLHLEALRTVLGYCAHDLEGETPKCREGRSPKRMQLSLLGCNRGPLKQRYPKQMIEELKCWPLV